MRIQLSLAFFLIALAARADVLNVPGDFPTIQAALDAAQDGDEIVLAPGTYENPGVNAVGGQVRSIELRSEDPEDPAIVAQTILFDPEDDPMFDIDFSQPSSITFDGLTFRRPAQRISEPALRVIDADLTIRRCVFDGGNEPTSGNGLTFEANEGASLGTGEMSVRLEEVRFIGRVGSFSIDAPDIAIDALDAAGVFGSPRLRLFAGDLGGGVEISDSVLSIETEIFNNDLAAARITDTTFTNREATILTISGSADLERVTFDRIARASQSTDIGVAIGQDLNAIDLTIRDSGNDRVPFLFNIGGITTADGVILENNAANFVVFHMGATSSPIDAQVADIRNLTATGNVGPFGVVEWHGSGSIRDSTFRRNQGQAIGLFNAGGGSSPTIRDVTIMIESCVFEHNTPYTGDFGPSGSLIGQDDKRLFRSSVTLRDSVFRANQSGRAGVLGFKDAFSDASIVFDQCLIVGNLGSVAPVHVGSAVYRNSTIIDNAASDELTRLGLGNAELVNTIVSDRFPLQPAVAPIPSGIDPDAALTVGSSLVSPTNFGQGSSTLDPLFVRMPSDGGDGWGDDPATPDADESLNDDFGDLRLRRGSPAIDTGTNHFLMPGDLDLDGNPRLADDPGIPGSNADIGAYEFQGTTCLADVNQDGELNPNDFNAWILAFNENSPLADQNRDGDVRQNDFNAWILNFNTGCP
ncbi:MAG: GC-type dockerin domain-anchored protein [Planctomycetota bacterium]